jgi:hypothetical protein
MRPSPKTAHELPKLWAGLDRSPPTDPGLGLLMTVQKASSGSPFDSEFCGNSYSNPESGDVPDETDADAMAVVKALVPPDCNQACCVVVLLVGPSFCLLFESVSVSVL